MFYSQSLLSKKGPLGNIWIAAYFYKKLKKEQITQTNIPSSIDKIIPEVQMSYRVLAHLLLGVVRIFSKKVDFLYDDCNEVLTKLGKPFLWTQRDASKSTSSALKAVHAPDHVAMATLSKETDLQSHDVIQSMEAICAPNHGLTITLPENFELDSFDLEVPEEDLNGKTDKQLTLEGAREDEWNRPSFLSESYHEGTLTHSDFYSPCFTPMEDVFPPHMMDVDLEIHELHNSSGLEVRLEKLKGDLPPLQECGNRSSVRKTLNLDTHAQEPDHQAELVKTKLSDLEISHVLEKRYAEAIMQTEDLIPFPCPSGAVSPGFTVSTPGIRERYQMSRKRKHLFDETIVLSNQDLRQSIHDASCLICKRRKAPHTSLDAWKVHKISNLQKNFMEPLIPCFSLAFKPLYQEKFSDTPAVRRYTGLANKSDEHAKLTEHGSPTQEINSPQDLVAVASTEVLIADELDAGRCQEQSAIETSDSEMGFIDRESTNLDEDSSGQGGWSARARSVARYLCNAFLNQKEQEQKMPSLSLAKILEGNKRAKCAKFFYMTLILKGLGYVDVEQESAYGDIIMSATPEMVSRQKDCSLDFHV